MTLPAPNRLADTLRHLGDAVLLAPADAALDTAALRVLPLERDGLRFAVPPGTPPARVLAVKHALQHHVDLAAREAEVARMSTLFGDRLVALLDALGRQAPDETGLARMFDFLGEDTRLAVMREGQLLFNRGLDPHTLRIAQRRVASVRVHAAAIGHGELFTCRCDAYDGFFLRGAPFATIERALVELHLNLLSTHLRQQALHQSLARLNDAFEREFVHAMGTTPAPLDGPSPVAAVERHFNHLLEAALKDSLTQAYNRHKTGELLDQLCRRDDRFSVILLDVDHFKSINDRHGHLAGDRVLVEIARRCRDAIGDAGLVARWGGEEFLAILRGADAAQATARAETVRAALAAAPVALPGADEAGLAVTASLGVAERRPGETPAQLVERADRALYEAKAAGRDRVRTA